MFFSVIARVIGSEQAKELFTEALNKISNIGDRKTRLDTIKALTAVLKVQQKTILDLTGELEKEGRDSVALAEMHSALAEFNMFAYEVINEAADWRDDD